MTPLLRLIDWLLKTTLALLMAGLTLNVLWQVASRYLFNDPSSVTEEVARFLLLWIGLLGGAYAYRNGAHLGLDLLTAKLGDPAWIRYFTLAVVVLFSSLVMVYGGGKLVLLTLQLKQTSPALGIPMGYVYTVLPLSGVLITFFSIVQWRALVRRP